MKVETLDELLKTRSHLNEIIISKVPATQAEREDMEELVVARDRITIAINNVIEKGFLPNTAGLEQACNELWEINKRLEKAAKTVQAVKDGIEISAQVLGVVAKIVPFVV